jgi:hypothetical protein
MSFFDIFYPFILFLWFMKKKGRSFSGTKRIIITIWGDSWGHAVMQLVEALRYKPEGRGFDSRFLPVALWPLGRLSL